MTIILIVAIPAIVKVVAIAVVVNLKVDVWVVADWVVVVLRQVVHPQWSVGLSIAVVAVGVRPSSVLVLLLAGCSFDRARSCSRGGPAGSSVAVVVTTRCCLSVSRSGSGGCSLLSSISFAASSASSKLALLRGIKSVRLWIVVRVLSWVKSSFQGLPSWNQAGNAL